MGTMSLEQEVSPADIDLTGLLKHLERIRDVEPRSN